MIDQTSLTMIARRLKAMADPSRLSLLHALCGGERNVTDLVTETGFSQANVSKHLRVLREEELVSTRRDRNMVYYRLTSELPREICGLIGRSLEHQARTERTVLSLYRRTMHE
ncbi:MAG TPA: metalloregulator ArsR/SmtB family transcription factor [Patescibacteria group bacterium]|nr:metalloregulator ArsR/SmtB family transcription factor [Patescibacteria group bacterium]